MAKITNFRVTNKDLHPFPATTPIISDDANVDEFKITMPQFYGDINLASGEIVINCVRYDGVMLNNLSVQDIDITGGTISFTWLITPQVTAAPGYGSFHVTVKGDSWSWQTNNAVYAVRAKFATDDSATEIPSDLIPQLILVGEHAYEILVDVYYDDVDNTYVYTRLDGSIVTIPAMGGGSGGGVTPDQLAAAIAVETQAREVAVSDLQNQIDELVNSGVDEEAREAIAQEVLDRQAADAALQQQIDNIEINPYDDSWIQPAIDTAVQDEADLRIAADTALSEQINEVASDLTVPNDGFIYARRNNEWIQLDHSNRTVYVDGSSTAEIEDGSINFPYKTLPALASEIASFGDIIDIGPGTYTGDFTVDVSNLGLFTDGAIGQYRAQLDGNLHIAAIRCEIANFQVLGDITTEPDTELLYMTNVDVGSLTYSGSGYSRCDTCFWERVVTVESGTVDLRGCQFENSADFNFVIQTGATGTAFFSTNMNVDHAGGSFTGGEGNVYAGIQSTANAVDGSEYLYILGGTFTGGAINKTGQCPYILAAPSRNFADDVLVGTRIEVAPNTSDILADYTPVNYAASGNYLSDHLAGIDAVVSNSSGVSGIQNVTATDGTIDVTITANIADIKISDSIQTDINEAVADSTEALQVAEAAQTTAVEALDAAQTAQTAANTANSSIVDIRSDITDLQTNATELGEQVSQAQASADAAASTAQAAQTDATEALDAVASKIEGPSAPGSYVRTPESWVSIQSIQVQNDVIYVDPVNGTVNGTGSALSPINTLDAVFASVDNRTGKEIILAPGQHTISDPDILADLQDVIIRGYGSSGSILTSITTNETGDTIEITTSASGVSFENIDFSTTSKTVRLSGATGTGFITFNNCKFYSFINYSTSQTATIDTVFENCYFVSTADIYGIGSTQKFYHCEFNYNKPASENAHYLITRSNSMRVDLYSCKGVYLNHSAGTVIADGFTEFITAGAGFCITSTASGLNNVLVLMSGTTLQTDGTYGRIYQADPDGYYIIGAFVRNPDTSQDLFTGTRLGGGILDEDISVSYTPVNYTPTSSSLSGHLEGIDEALGG